MLVDFSRVVALPTIKEDGEMNGKAADKKAIAAKKETKGGGGKKGF